MVKAPLIIGDRRLQIHAPSIKLVARKSLYRSGQMIGILDLGIDSPALFIVAPRIELEKIDAA